MFQMLSRDEKRCVAQALAATLLADVARFGMIDKDTRSAANPIVVKLLEDDCVRWASVAERLVSISDSDAFIASKAGKRALTSVLHIRPNLRDIDLISDCLCTNKVLTSLDISHNFLFGNEGATVLARALRVNTSLKKLRLVYDSIGDVGANALFDALCFNETLTNLNLDHNSIHCPGGIAIANALAVNRALTRLSLHNNMLRDNGAAAIFNALRRNNVLTELVVSRNLIRVAGLEILCAGGALTKLTKLDIQNNTLSNPTMAAIINAVRGR